MLGFKLIHVSKCRFDLCQRSSFEKVYKLYNFLWETWYKEPSLIWSVSAQSLSKFKYEIVSY